MGFRLSSSKSGLKNSLPSVCNIIVNSHQNRPSLSNFCKRCALSEAFGTIVYRKQTRRSGSYRGSFGTFPSYERSKLAGSRLVADEDVWPDRQVAGDMIDVRAAGCPANTGPRSVALILCRMRPYLLRCSEKGCHRFGYKNFVRTKSRSKQTGLGIGE
ncbi:hypothetical protein EVAR_27248_1 [Eumeta japonica]|uniref:Uncharacterized protein n=1 Tax=Eumeta variegata TaxID=151549 RepID=A0A4C1W159_EUMVA|nr:hypothetical protein EVAR_27248_1 [Eumeta japonica]